MKYVAVKKNDPKLMKKCGLPENYPLTVSEHFSLEEATRAFNGEICAIEPVEKYNRVMSDLRKQHEKSLVKLERVKRISQMSLLGRIAYWLKELFFK